MRHAIIALVLLGATPAIGDDRQLCDSGQTPLETRVAACERLLPGADDQVDAILDIGRAYQAAESFEDALHWYDQAIEIDPDHYSALGRRSVVLGALERWEEAEADLRHLVAHHADEKWGFYRLGWLLTGRGRYDEAIAALETSIALDSDYFWAWLQMGRAQEGAENPAAAGAAYHQVTRLRPFDIDYHFRAFREFRDAELMDEAAFHARIIFTLNPNETLLGDWLTGYMGSEPVTDLPPLDYSPAAETQSIRYFAIHAPVDTRSEIEIAIGALGGFFSGASEPVPETAAILNISHEVLDETRTLPSVEIEHERAVPPQIGTPSARYYGMFPFEFQPGGPGTPLVEPRFDAGDLSDIWPLSAGHQAQGQGRFVVDCSLGRGFQYSVMGCVPGVEEAELGPFSWSVEVSTERLHVPLGLFDTYRLDVTMTGAVTVLGVEREIPYSASFWITPEIDGWIARRLTVEGEYVLSQAMAVIVPE